MCLRSSTWIWLDIYQVFLYFFLQEKCFPFFSWSELQCRVQWPLCLLIYEVFSNTSSEWAEGLRAYVNSWTILQQVNDSDSKPSGFLICTRPSLCHEDLSSIISKQKEEGFCPLQVASIPQDGRWRLHGAAQSGLPCLTRSHYWAEGPGLRHSAQPCSLRRCEAASASSCLWRLHPQSVSATPGRPPANIFERIFRIWTQSLCERVSYLVTVKHVLTSLQEATARCRGVSHLLSLAFTLAPTIEMTV